MSVRTPSYRHHKPTGQAVVTISGRDVYLGRHGTPASRDEYDRVIGEWLANGRLLPTASGLSVAELILAYWHHVERYYVKGGKPTSEVDTIRQALRFLREPYGRTRAADFGPLALKAVRQAMVEHGLCRSYVNKQVDRVRRMFAWAAENEMLPISTHQALANVAGLRRGRSEAREKAPIAPVSASDVERTLPHLPPTVAAMVRVQLLTGMRPGEVTSMRVPEVDRSDPSCWVYRPSTHKSDHHDRERVIFIGPRAQAVLREHIDREPIEGGGGYVFDPRASEADRRAEQRKGRRSPMTPSQRARTRKAEVAHPIRDHYRVDSYRKAIRRACLKAGIPVWHPHQVRHTAATGIRARFGLEGSQVVLGHAELGVTQVYAEADLQRARSIMSEAG